MRFKNTDLLGYVRAYVRDNIDGSRGIICPCCWLLAKRYKRPFHSGMALGLIVLYQLSQKTEWVDVNDIYRLRPGKSVGPSNFPSLRHWGMAEPKTPDPDIDEKASGLWRILGFGIDFVEEKASARNHIVMYGPKCQGTGGKLITIHDALGKKFSYKELMEGSAE